MAVLAVAAAVSAISAGAAAATGVMAVATAAQIGWMVGALVGNMFFGPKPPSPKINDVRVQDSAYGKIIPRVYGMYRVAGNVMWAGQPHQHTSGGKGMGKGGGGQTVVRMSFAIGLCEGPIQGVRRVWANGKLVYDISNPSNFAAISGSNQMLTNFVVYNGDESQLPDPTMESQLGVGNVPAHRGLAYVVFNELDLSEWGNFLPSFSFEIVTGVSTTYVMGTVGQYTQGQSVGTFTGLSAQGGYHVDYTGYPAGQYIGVGVQNVTPYGIKFDNPLGQGAYVFPSDVPSWGASAQASWSDSPGFLANSSGTWNWFTLDGFIQYGVAGLPSGAVGIGRTFVKLGNNIWASCNYGGMNFPIVGFTLGLQNNPTGAGQIFATSTLQKPFEMLGVTQSYVYAADGSYLYQFNATTLTVNQQWPTSIALGLNQAQCGHAVDDRHVYIYGAGKLFVFDSTTGVATLLGSGYPAFGQTMQAVSPGLFLIGDGGGATDTLYYIAQTFATSGSVGMPLSTIVADICTRAGLTSSQYDVSQLTDIVAGYAITTNASARDNLGPLMGAYFFDVTDADGKLTFVKRGGATVGTFAYADLGAANSLGDPANETPLQVMRAQEADLPKQLTLTYCGLNNDYQMSSQIAFRTTTKSNKEATLSVPICLGDDEGLQKAQTMLWNAWIAREEFTFSTPLAYLKYVPNDVVTLQGASASYTVRLVDCQFDAQGVLKWTALSEAPAIYTSTAAGGPSAGFTQQVVPYSGPSDIVVLDVPPLRASDTSPGLYIGATGYTSSWPGCTVEVSRDGNSFTDLVAITGASVIGSMSTALPNFGGGNQPDELSTATVVIDTGTLASVTYANFLAGNSAAVIGSEIVYFRNATLIAANTYRLSGFLRGVGGTEWAMGSHVNGEAFILLGNTLASVGLNVHDIGSTLYFETRLLNIFSGQVTAARSLTPSNARVQPLSPSQFRALPGSAASTSDISLFWTRRARVNAAWLNGTDVPLDEQTESYLVTIKNSTGATVRTATVLAAQTYVYSAANIAADGFSAGNTISFSVAQNSDLGVLGRASSATITR